MDGLPLLQLDFAQHVVLDDDHLVQLVDLRVHDSVLDGVYRPDLNLVLLDLSRRHKWLRKNAG